MFRIRLECSFSPLGKQEEQMGECWYSREVPLGEADAYLAYWTLPEDFLTFSGPRLYYCCEPLMFFKQLRHWRLRRAVYSLPRGEWAHHRPDGMLPVPHHTHYHDRVFSGPAVRQQRIAAVVAHLPGPFDLRSGLRYRFRFLQNSAVNVYGRESSWKRRRIRGNYQGEIPGPWGGFGKYEILASYQAVLCLENSWEPNYFSEKFLAAVQADAIPIYRAHPTVAKGILQGAKWVDPADFDHDPARTIAFALSQDREEYTAANRRWFLKPQVQTTHVRAIVETLGRALYRQGHVAR